MCFGFTEWAEPLYAEERMGVVVKVGRKMEDDANWSRANDWLGESLDYEEHIQSDTHH